MMLYTANPRRGMGAAVSPQVQSIAQAIAHAEGYYLPSGAVNSPSAAPVRNNNPCDLTSGGALSSYPDIGTGWSKCYGQINAIVNDTSSVYTSDMSISDIASHWAPAPSAACGAMCAGNVPANWASTVAGQLGVDPSASFGGYASGNPALVPATDLATADTTTPAYDPTTGLPVDTSTDTTATDAGSAFDFSFTDGQGNLTPLAWGGIGVGLLGVLMAVASGR